MPLTNSTTNKIEEFRNLVEGWHFGEGFAPNDDTIKVAIFLNGVILNEGFTETDAFPGINGEIQITGYNDSLYVELTAEPNRLIIFVLEYEDETVVYEESLSLNQAIARIKFWGTEWTSSGLFTRTSLTTVRDVSPVLLFSPVGRMAASPSLKQGVYEEQAQVYAAISSDITKGYQETHPYSGKSTQNLYLHIASSHTKQAQLEMSATTI